MKKIVGAVIAEPIQRAYRYHTVSDTKEDVAMFLDTYVNVINCP